MKSPIQRAFESIGKRIPNKLTDLLGDIENQEYFQGRFWDEQGEECWLIEGLGLITMDDMEQYNGKNGVEKLESDVIKALNKKSRARA